MLALATKLLVCGTAVWIVKLICNVIKRCDSDYLCHQQWLIQRADAQLAEEVREVNRVLEPFDHD